MNIRKLGTIRRGDLNDPDKQLDKVIADTQNNFDTINREVRSLLVPAVPAAGTIGFVCMDENGDLILYTLVAGAGVTLTLDSVDYTLTITSP